MIKKVLTGSFILCILIYIALIHVIPYGIIKPPIRTIDLTDIPSNLDTVSISVEGFGEMKGYWVTPDSIESKGVMILVHGIAGYKEHFLNLAQVLASEGIETVFFDNRAHGKSGGEFCTYGYNEKNDISRIVDYIKLKRPNAKIGIWGNSLGGAIAIQALANDKRLLFGISESTFTNLDDVVYQYQKRICFGVGLKFLTDISLAESGRIAGFDPFRVNPIESIKSVRQPILIAHGDSDDNISVQNAYQLYNTVKVNNNASLVIIPNGEHFGLMETGGSDYKETLLNFINYNFSIL